MASRDINDLESSLQSLCIKHLSEMNKFFNVTNNGVQVILSCTWRSCSEQHELFKVGRTLIAGNWVKIPFKKVLTNADAGESAHNYFEYIQHETIEGETKDVVKRKALGYDIFLLRNGKPIDRADDPAWENAGKIGMALGLDWLGRKDSPFKEACHFQLKDWKLYRSKDWFTRCSG